MQLLVSFFKKMGWVLPALFLIVKWGNAQTVSISSIYAKQTLQSERLKRRDGLYKYTINPLLGQQPDSTNEYQFQDALWSIGQFMLNDSKSRQLVDTLFRHYDSLELNTRRALIEVVYSLYPTQYLLQVKHLWLNEKDDRLLAVMSFYLKKENALTDLQVKSRLLEDKQRYDTSAVLQQLGTVLFPPAAKAKPRTVNQLFQNQSRLKTKVIYSFQRPDRNYPGLAIIQNADGSFVKDSVTSQLKTFVQLARSAADLPYFITNGSTPQGVYRIKGTGISHNSAIGPTPNLQLRMPFEVVADSFFIQPNSTTDSSDVTFLTAYNDLFPSTWQGADMNESFYAGKCGRGAIIAHGTTLDPWYYQGQSFYPCTPTLGCLCAKEIWNPNTGRLIQSDQLDMVNTFLATPGEDGYLFVINLADKKSAVTPEEVTALINEFETTK